MCAIHCDAADSGPVQKVHLSSRRAGILAVVGTTGIDLKGAREKAAAAAAEPESETDSEAESEDEPEGPPGGIGEEESQGASRSSGAGRRMTET